MGRKRRPELDLSLRRHHLGINFSVDWLRLELYRLVCYLHGSEFLTGLSDGLDLSPFHAMRDEFQNTEVPRILLQVAVVVRYIGAGHADPSRAHRDLLDSTVGLLVPNLSKSDQRPLSLREACNKIIHAKNVSLDWYEKDPIVSYVKPTVVTLYDDWEKKQGWKADLQVLPFVEACWWLCELH